MRDEFRLEDLKIASPCDQRWDSMTGDERVRLCEKCALHVYNFEAMTRAEVKDLVLRTEGRFCGRFYRRTDGTVVTSDCPVAFDRLKHRVGIAAGSFFSLVGMAIGAMLFLARGRYEAVNVGEVPAVKKVCNWATGNQPSHQAMAGGIVAMPMGSVTPTPLPPATPAAQHASLVQLRHRKTARP